MIDPTFEATAAASVAAAAANARANATFLPAAATIALMTLRLADSKAQYAM